MDYDAEGIWWGWLLIMPVLKVKLYNRFRANAVVQLTYRLYRRSIVMLFMISHMLGGPKCTPG
jgi:hypothetical protein